MPDPLYVRSDVALRRAHEVEMRARQREALQRWEASPGPDALRERLALRHWSWIAEQTRYAWRFGPAVVVAHRHPWISGSLQRALQAAGWAAHDACASPFAGMAAVLACQPDVLVVSEQLTGGSGLTLLSRTAALCPDTRLVMHLRDERLLEHAIQSGADVVLPPTAQSGDLHAVLDTLRSPGRLTGATPVAS